MGDRQGVDAPVRGSILDRNDKVLAVEATAYTIALNPKIIDEYHVAEDVTQGLSRYSERIRSLQSGACG